MASRIVLLLLSAIFLRPSDSALVQRQEDCKNIQYKCTSKDPRMIYPRCMMYSPDQSLWCDQSNYTKIPNPESISSSTKYSCKNAMALYINDSCLSDISKDDLTPYKSIQIFMCGRNYIRSLKGRIFHSNIKLVTIDFCTNNIKKIDSETFSGLRGLKTLNLANNNIDDLESGTFFDLASLHEMSLHNNELSDLRDDVFMGLRSLKILKLTKNRINRLSSITFKHLYGLTHLHLDENKMREIESGTFDELTSLEVLTISHNKLKSLGQNSLPNLHTFNIASNHFVEFHSFSVSNLPSLQNLDLSNNSLKTVQEDLFQNNAHLRNLNFGDNLLKSIPRETFHGLCHLETLVLRNNRLRKPIPHWFTNIIKNGRREGNDLSSNRWHCDCDAMEHRNFVFQLRLKQSPWKDLFEINCESPKEWKQKTLTQISGFQNCQPLESADEQLCNKSHAFIPQTDTYEYSIEREIVATESLTTTLVSHTEISRFKTLAEKNVEALAEKIIYGLLIAILICLIAVVMISYGWTKSRNRLCRSSSEKDNKASNEDSKLGKTIYDDLEYE